MSYKAQTRNIPRWLLLYHSRLLYRHEHWEALGSRIHFPANRIHASARSSIKQIFARDHRALVFEHMYPIP